MLFWNILPRRGFESSVSAVAGRHRGSQDRQIRFSLECLVSSRREMHVSSRMRVLAAVPRPFRGRLLLGHPLQTPTTPRDSSLKIPPKGCRFWISDMTGTQSPWFLPGEDSIGVAARSRFQCSMRGSTFLGLALLLSFISSSAECAGGTKPNLCRVGGGCPRAIRRGLSPLACRLMRLRGGGNYYR